jgi:murein DD-endopeptidase MepM/ murein hydrolase activator NlpD
VNSRFGNRNSGNHCGIDLHLRTGDTVYASNFGKVRFSKYHKGGYGNLIVLSHSNGIETYYAHLSNF